MAASAGLKTQFLQRSLSDVPAIPDVRTSMQTAKLCTLLRSQQFEQFAAASAGEEEEDTAVKLESPAEPSSAVAKEMAATRATEALSTASPWSEASVGFTTREGGGPHLLGRLSQGGAVPKRLPSGELKRLPSGELKSAKNLKAKASPKVDSDSQLEYGIQTKLRRLPEGSGEGTVARRALAPADRQTPELAAADNSGDNSCDALHNHENEQTSDGQSPEPVRCRVAAQSWAGKKQGVKKQNQDAYSFMRSEEPKCFLFGVYDGHGPNGHQVAQTVKEKLPLCLIKDPLLPQMPKEALCQTFVKVDDGLASEVDCVVSGTTAVLAIIQGRQLTVAGVGDSRAVLGRRVYKGSVEAGSIQAVQLTHDHKPDNREELKRITASNGRVDRLTQNGVEVGPYRVWLGPTPILGLGMSRSLGDGLAHTVGVSALPQVQTVKLQEEDSFLILASDGVWDHITNSEAVAIVGSTTRAESGCKKLMQTARARWQEAEHGSYIDDITAIVIGLSHFGEPQPGAPPR